MPASYGFYACCQANSLVSRPNGPLPFPDYVCGQIAPGLRPLTAPPGTLIRCFLARAVAR
jgi:hypothetical protein